jgi:hypothetical protein
MDVTPSEALIIPFGAANWPLGRLAELREAPSPSLPVALWSRGRMLRLNDDALQLPPPPPGADTPMPQRIAAHVKWLYGGWNKAAELFVDQYFAFLQSRIEQHRAELAKRLVPFEGLFRADDYLYSAPLPLPHAFLLAPAKPVTGGSADYVKTDFAFCLETRRVAVLLAPSPLTPMAARRQQQRLADAGIKVAECKAADLADGHIAWFTRVLGPDACRFWEGVALPAAPSPPGLPVF